jgi:hypothetical protein
MESKHMTIITSFDKKNAKAVQDSAVVALQEVAKHYGLEIRAHGGRLDTGVAVLKFEFKVADPPAKEKAERHEFGLYCPAFGLTPAHYGATIMHKGRPHLLVGFSPRRSKFPYRVRSVDDGRELLLTETSLRFLKTGGLKAVS